MRNARFASIHRCPWQRGTARVAVLGAVAALLGLGTFALQREASSTPVTAIPVATTTAATGALDACQAPLMSMIVGQPGIDEVENMEQVVLLQAGKTLALRVLATSKGGFASPERTATIQAGGTWSADFGTINQNGDYVAPPHTPPFGLDTVKYEDRQGTEVHLQIRILPNPALPGSGSTPYVQAPWSVDGSTPPVPYPPVYTPGSPPELPPLPAGGSTVVVGPGETPPLPIEFAYVEAIPVETIRGTQAYRLPATDGFSTVKFIYAENQAGQEALQQARLVPPPPPEDLLPPTQCVPGTFSAGWTPYVVTPSEPVLPPIDLASITITAGIKAQLGVLGAQFNVGAVVTVKGILTKSLSQ